MCRAHRPRPRRPPCRVWTALRLSTHLHSTTQQARRRSVIVVSRVDCVVAERPGATVALSVNLPLVRSRSPWARPPQDRAREPRQPLRSPRESSCWSYRTHRTPFRRRRRSSRCRVWTERSGNPSSPLDATSRNTESVPPPCHRSVIVAAVAGSSAVWSSPSAAALVAHGGTRVKRAPAAGAPVSTVGASTTRSGAGAAPTVTSPQASSCWSYRTHRTPRPRRPRSSRRRTWKE